MNTLDHVPEGAFVGAVAKVPQSARKLIEAGWVSIFDQDEVWRTKAGEWVEIASMEPSHVVNLARWMERNVEPLRWKWQITECFSPLAPQGDVASLHFERWLDGELARPALEWLRDRRLYRALCERIARTPAPEPVPLPGEVAS